MRAIAISDRYTLCALGRDSFGQNGALDERALGNPSNTVFVSVASLYEIGIKVRSGKLPAAVEFERNLPVNIRSMGYELVELSASVVMRAARFPSRMPIRSIA